MIATYSTSIQAVLCLLWAICASGITWYIVRASAQITYVTLADGRRQERRLPFLLRILLPLMPSLSLFFKRAQFKPARKRILWQLTTAGFEDIISPHEFLAIRILMPLIIAPIFCIILLGLFALSTKSITSAHAWRLFALFCIILIWACLYPRFWLKQAIALRHKLILRALPFVMDLLTLSVEAGLDFLAAVKNIITRRKPDPLCEEFSRLLVEIQVGLTRREALKNLAERVNLPDINTLVTALVQADELGVSIGGILRVQSEQVRGKRFMRAETLANEAPVKMLFPLVACIFPAVFLILLGPIILQLLRQSF